MSGKRALVTGGSRGVGAAVAAGLAEAGFTVAVHCRADVAAAETVVAGLPGSGHTVVSGDLADPGEVASFVGDAVAGLGGLDVLVNNAGVHTDQPITATTYDEWRAGWRRVIDVNVHGTANVTWCFVDHLRTRPRVPKAPGSSTSARAGPTGASPTPPRTGPARRRCTRWPSRWPSPWHRTVSGSRLSRQGSSVPTWPRACSPARSGDGIRAQSPFGRVAEPGDVASAVTWLALPGSLWASGAVIDLNGASHLR